MVLIPALALLLVSSCVNNPNGEKADTKDSVAVGNVTDGVSFVVDTAQSELVWTGAKVTGQHTGTIDIKDGFLLLKDSLILGGTFNIDLTTIHTTDLEGEAKNKLDAHLKGSDFFDVEKYPTANFQITAVEKGKLHQAFKISGNLTIKGITKNITFEAHVVENTGHVIKLGADFNIVRGDWGINYEGKADDLIAKEINFKIALSAIHTPN